MQQLLNKTVDRFFHDLAISELRIEQSRKASCKLTYNDMMYINIIEANSGKYTVSSLASLLNISKPSVTNKINELEKMGYIRKQQDTVDKRIYYIHFNTEAVAHMPQFESYYTMADRISEKILAKYAVEDLQTFCTLLAEISQLHLDESAKLIEG